MPKYQCEKCGAIWYGWAGAEEACQKCGGKLKRVEENSNDKKKKKRNKAFIRCWIGKNF